MTTSSLTYFVRQNLEIILLSMIPATLFLKENVNSYFLLLYLLYWLYKGRYKNIDRSVLRRLRLYFVFVALYIAAICIGNLFSSDIRSANNFLIKQLTLLAFPVLLSHIRWTEKNKKTFNEIFLGATLVFLTLIWLKVIYNIIDAGSLYTLDPAHPTWKYYFFTSGRLSPQVHPTFLSIYIIYCIFYVESRIKRANSLQEKIIHYGLISLFVINLLLLSSRGALLSLLIVFVGYEVIKLITQKDKSAMAKLALMGLGVVLVFSNTSIFSRISKVSNMYDKPLAEIANIHNSIGNRAQIYMISGKIIEENFWLGIGSQNWAAASKEYYDRYFRERFEYDVDTLNTHNQYLNSWVSWGIGGVLLLGCIVFFPIHLSYKSGNIELCKFSIFFLLVLLTENVLDRHRGIIFFSCISSYIILQAIRKPPYES